MSENQFEAVPHEQPDKDLRKRENLPLFAALSPEQRSRLILHLSGKTRERQNSDQVSPLPRGPYLDRLPLSFAQQRLWFLNQLRPDNPFYNIFVAIHLEGPLCVQALQKSLNEVIRRHEVLRTTFRWDDDQPYQRIATELYAGIRIVDLQSLSSAVRYDNAEALAIKESRIPFNLSQGPLLRMLLIRIEPESHIMAFVLHHIISDNWSTSLIIKELNAYYHAFTTNQPINLPTLPVQYADFTLWQQQWLSKGIQQQQLDHWIRKLAGAPTILTLPADHPWPPIPSYRGKTLFFRLSPELSEALWNISQQEGATLFMTLLAAYAILLSRFSGQEELLIGIPIANRTRREWENLVGFLANMLALRIDLRGDLCYRDVLERTREVALEAYAHQDLPFEQLVHALRLPKKDKSRNPLVQAVFSFQSTPIPVKNLLGVHGKELIYDRETAKFDLTLNMKKIEHQLSGKLNYNTDIFEAATIARLLQDFLALLEVVACDPGQKIKK